MNTFRNEIAANFTTIPNVLCNDKRLTAKAKGIFLYLASKSDNWQFYMNEIVKNFTDGKTAIQSGIKELETYGYLVRRRSFDEFGKINGYNWTLSMPDEDETHQIENPLDGKPINRETPSHNKTKDTNTKENNNKEQSIKDELFDIFWDKYPNKVNKQSAKIQFNKLNDTNKQLCMKTAEPYSNYKEFEGYKHCHATTFISGERYLNDYKELMDKITITATNKVSSTSLERF